MPLPPFPAGPHTQPYAIPPRGALHGPIGGVPGNRAYAGRGSAGGPIGGHLSHHQPSQGLGGIGGFNFGGLDGSSSQPSMGPLTQQGLMTQGLSQNLRKGYSLGGMSQDFLAEDFKSQGSHVGYNGPEFSAQAGMYGVDFVTQGTQGTYPGDYMNQNSQGYGSSNEFVPQDFLSHGSQNLFTQVGFGERTQEDPSAQAHYGLGGHQGIMGPMYSQPFTQYTQPLNQQHPTHYNG